MESEKRIWLVYLNEVRLKGEILGPYDMCAFEKYEDALEYARNTISASFEYFAGQDDFNTNEIVEGDNLLVFEFKMKVERKYRKCMAVIRSVKLC